MMIYFDCFSGISGDMTLGAFVDLGVPLEWLEQTIKSNLMDDFEISSSATSKMGIAAKQIEVVVKNHTERDYSSISDMISESDLPDRVKTLSMGMFEKLAIAESAIHGCPIGHVHFHEVGGVDAIVDIVGASLCVDYLNVDTVTASKIPLGRGFVNSSHGTLPVPAPATLAILKGVPVYGTNIPFEIVTPTGAAIVTTLAANFGKMPDMLISGIGYGSGSRTLETVPNLLRIVSGKAVVSSDAVIMIETCIDDMNPEVFGYLMERLFDDGALDVYLVPVFMKKNRPGTLLQVLCQQHIKETIIKRIFTETTTIGIRYYDMERRLLEREEVKIKTEFGVVSAKRIRTPDGIRKIVPEYEQCRQIALKEGIPIRLVYEKIAQHIET